MREIRLLHQTSERLEILRAANGRVAAREAFDYLRPIASSVLPEFTLTVHHILQE